MIGVEVELTAAAVPASGISIESAGVLVEEATTAVADSGIFKISSGAEVEDVTAAVPARLTAGSASSMSTANSNSSLTENSYSVVIRIDPPGVHTA